MNFFRWKADFELWIPMEGNLSHDLSTASGSQLCWYHTLSGEVWIYGPSMVRLWVFRNYCSTISAPGLVNKSPNIFLMHPMLNVCNPSSYTYELILQVSGIISTGIHLYCASCPCWIFMQLLRALQEVNHLSDLPDVWSDHWISLAPLFRISTCCQSGRISCVVDLSGLSIPWTETNGRYCGWSSMELASKVDLISGPRMLCILVYWL